MLKVASRFGVSSSYMARVCTELRVPRPERGYWAKLEFGKAEQRPALPTVQPGDELHWRPGTAIGTTQRTAARERKERKPRAILHGELKEHIHPLLVGVKPHFLKTRENDSGFLKPFKRLLVDLVVSERILDSSIVAANALFKALTARGHRVVFASPEARIRRADVDQREVVRKNHNPRYGWSPDRATVVYIGDVCIGLTLFETSEHVEMMYVGNSKYIPVRDLTAEQLRRFKEPHYWKTTRDLPSGRLALQAYSSSWRVKWSERWPESDSGKFPSMVSRIVRELEREAPVLSQKLVLANQQAEEEHRKRKEDMRRAEEDAERKRREKAQLDSRNDLLGAIASWEQVRSVHAFFASIDDEISHLPELEREEARSRLEMARELIGKVDPLARLKQWKSPNER